MKKGFSAFLLLIVIIVFQQKIMGSQNLKKTHPESAGFEKISNLRSLQDTTPQKNANDTLPYVQRDTIIGKVIDTIAQDTLIDSLQLDTLRKIIQDDTILVVIKDTIPEKPLVDTMLIRDTIIVRDTIEKQLPDSLTHFFFKPETKLDSAITYWNRYAIKDTSSMLTDSMKNRIKNFLFYAKSHPVDSTLQFTEDFLKTDTTFSFYRDSSRLTVNDSLYQYLSYLLNTTKKDSVQFTISNRSRDSINLWLKKDPRDSIRFILYDHKDYPAGLWIKPQSKNSLKLSFVEDVHITETEQQKTLKEMLPVDMSDYKLRQQEHVDMIFPEWDLDGITNAHFSQGYLSNWSRGGESSLSTLWNLRYSADYSLGNKISWDNDLEYKIGLLKSGKKKLRKNEDKLEINSKFGSNAVNNWYYSALLNFQTQFFTGYNYPNTENPISGFLAPARLVFSIGMDYNPRNDLTILLSPVSSKFTMMRDTVKFDQTYFGIPENQKVKKELGAYIKSIFSIDFSNDISMENKVNFFINYLEKNESLDVDYEMTLNMKVTELINTTISTHLIFDKDVSPKIQFKENLSVGISYKLTTPWVL